MEFLNRKKYDLLALESFLADNSDLILIVCESPGSFAELGAFVNNESTLNKVVVLIQKKYKKAAQYSVFSYGGKYYYLGAISLYCPKKTHGNELYAARAKVNTHEGNAKYYFQKIKRMPGAITYFHHDADLNIYTGSKRVDFIKASPTTTSVMYH